MVYLQWAVKLSFILQKIFGTDLIAICDTKVTLAVNKPAYVNI